jgi:hypothetical protein
MFLALPFISGMKIRGRGEVGYGDLFAREVKSLGDISR